MNKRHVINEIEYLLRVKQAAERRLLQTSKYEGCRLSAKRNNNTLYYTIKYSGSSNKKAKYVGKDITRECELICERRLLKRILKIADTNLKLLNTAERTYQSINPNDLRDTLPEVYRHIPESVFNITETIDMSKVSISSYSTESAKYYPEHLSHWTPDGHKVRSKNELLAIYILQKLNIPFVYEYTLEINGSKRSIDFWLTTPDGTRNLGMDIFGMMNDPKYRSDKAQRISDFIQAGFTPGKDILFVYCNSNESFDSSELERFLIRWLEEGSAAA